MTEENEISMSKQEYTEYALRIAEVRAKIVNYLKNTSNKLELVNALDRIEKITKDMVESADFNLRDQLNEEDIGSDQSYIS